MHAHITSNESFSYATRDHSPLQRIVIRTAERLGGQAELKRLYDDRNRARRDEESFFATALRLLAVDVRYDEERFAAIPASGPLVAIANHPYGVLDGLTLAALMLSRRPDVKVLTHVALTRVPEAREHLLPVDFAGTEAAAATNLATRRAAMRWLADGHAIGIFPGGGIATSERWNGRRAFDLPWAPFTTKLIRGSRATVVPFHFSGQNSRLFQLASHVSLTLRQSLIMRETKKRIGTRLDVTIGAPIPPAEIAAVAGREALIEELRRRTFALDPASGDAWRRNGRIRMPKAEARGAATAAV